MQLLRRWEARRGVAGVENLDAHCHRTTDHSSGGSFPHYSHLQPHGEIMNATASEREKNILCYACVCDFLLPLGWGDRAVRTMMLDNQHGSGMCASELSIKAQRE